MHPVYILVVRKSVATVLGTVVTLSHRDLLGEEARNLLHLGLAGAAKLRVMAVCGQEVRSQKANRDLATEIQVPL